MWRWLTSSIPMAEVAITPLGAREFLVAVSDGGHGTTHEVRVPEELGEGISLAGEDLERVVRASFDFLLEREPASSILSRFCLSEIARYFADYPRELARRLA